MSNLRTRIRRLEIATNPADGQHNQAAFERLRHAMQSNPELLDEKRRSALHELEHGEPLPRPVWEQFKREHGLP